MEYCLVKESGKLTSEPMTYVREQRTHFGKPVLRWSTLVLNVV